ncbi:FAD-binding oxidoreductase, partial [Phenylobacterium sp.]|uniref:FAD-binding oxidoreductase n=1 Tax=Phenylobacterium sp. TaxID=1871053 RepID=UPI0019949388
MAQFHSLTVAEVRHETDDCVSVRFDLPASLQEAFRFQHGQYLTLKTLIDGEEVRRSYSICAGVPENELRVAVKTVPGGKFSSYANGRLKPGDVLEVMAPQGRFTTPIEPEKAKSYVLFAAGSGITPVISIAKTVLALEPESEVTLFYGNRRTTSVIFREEIEDLKNRFMGRLRVFHVLSRESQDVDLLHGRLDRAKVDRLLDALVDVSEIDHVFVCGPEEMTNAVRAACA